MRDYDEELQHLMNGGEVDTGEEPLELSEMIQLAGDDPEKQSKVLAAACRRVGLDMILPDDGTAH